MKYNSDKIHLNGLFHCKSYGIIVNPITGIGSAQPFLALHLARMMS